MVVPDFELICEIMLVAEGFLEARLLARKFITLYSLCKELLSKQVIQLCNYVLVILPFFHKAVLAHSLQNMAKALANAAKRGFIICTLQTKKVARTR